MLVFREDYYDDEVRDGFYVPPMMKHCWAAQLEVLDVVREVCENHDIRFFACAGTLLGAIRHGGYIPWDDDVDICMLREDYMRFLEIAKKELPSFYKIRNMHESEGYRTFFTRIHIDGNLSIDSEYMRKSHGFYGVAGIDVFPLDYINTDDYEYRNCINDFIKLIQNYDAFGLSYIETELERVETLYSMNVSRKGNIGDNILCKLEELICSKSQTKEENVSLIYDWAQNANRYYSRRPYDDFVLMSFENIKLPVPYMYDSLLSSYFGDYIRPVKRGSTHNYPWYKGQHEKLDIKKFDYGESLISCANRRVLWEEEVHEQISQRMSLFMEAKMLVESKIEEGDIESARKLLTKCEELATGAELLEKRIKGNGKRRVVFLTWKAKYWDSLSHLYQRECQAEDTEVFVIPIPYFRYDEVGIPSEQIVEMDRIPENVEVTHFDNFDYEECRIDRIYIQNPYDDKNIATTVLPFFYSNNLIKLTDELIYVPWFEVDEFDEEDSRAVYNMKYYAIMPGVVTADRVILSSEWMKVNYVRELTKWAGETTREIWENKIEVIEKADEEAVGKSQSDNKTLVYYIGTGQVLGAKKKMVEKMRDNYRTFSNSQDRIRVRLVMDSNLKEIVHAHAEEIEDDFAGACKLYEEAEWCQLQEIDMSQAVMDSSIIDEIIANSDALYGDAGILMNKYSRAKKPVMVQNVEV